MQVSREDVLAAAALAKLRLSESETELLASQLGDIIQYVRQLDELATDDVQPLAHVGEVANVMADDEVAPSLDRESALANAPSRDEECFRVPAVLGD